LAADIVKSLQRYVGQFIEKQRAVKASGISVGTGVAEGLHTFLQTMENVSLLGKASAPLTSGMLCSLWFMLRRFGRTRCGRRRR
jgi:hypothetical protein